MLTKIFDRADNVDEGP